MGKHTYFVDEIIDVRGQRRGGERNGKLFCVLWAGGDTTWESIESFIDDNMVNELLKPHIAYYKTVAQRSPGARRHCLTCDNRVKLGNVFCNSTHCKEVSSYFDKVL